MPDIQIVAKGIDGRTVKIAISETASITDLKKRVLEEFTLGDDVRMIYTHDELCEKDDKKNVKYLKDYHIGNMAIIFVVLRLHGGPGSKVYGSDIELATEPDFMTYDDEVGGQRAKMPCGHVVGPDSLTEFCKTALAAGGFEFRCCYSEGTKHAPSCNAKWDFQTVRRMALLTDEEIHDFETRIADNYRKKCGIQKCPKCTSLCTRQRNKDQRVRCPVCSRKDGKCFDFCWFCLNDWRSSGTSACGNLECTGEDSRLCILKNVKLKKVIGVMCPCIRACPNCGIFIEHIDKCKHVACPCGTKFCFICLKMANAEGKYQCGSYDKKCEVAPVQTEIPTR